MENLKVVRWLMLIGGVLLLILGVMMFNTPLADIVGLAIFMGISIFISGVSEIGAFFSAEKGARSGWVLALGILATIIGMWVMFGRGLAVMTTTLPYMFAFWILFASVTQTMEAFTLKKAGVKSWFWVLILGIIGIILGTTLIFRPLWSALMIAYMFAFLFIVRGVGNIAMFFSVKLLEKYIKGKRGKVK
jgi:uncharacterized membrane protein HdeD (DUF308 family)